MDLKFLEESFKKGGSIHIKKKNRGKFTDYCGGKVTQSCINKAKASGNSTLKKRAVFAENARKWKHLNGGVILNPYYKIDIPNLGTKKYEDGGEIYAEWNALEKPKEDVYAWASRNPFDYTYRLETPFSFSNNSLLEEPSNENSVEDSTYALTFKDYDVPEISLKKEAGDTTSEKPKSGSNNTAVLQAFNYFTAKGLTKELASGLVGNFLAESNLNTAATNKEEKKAGYSGYGRGIALWSNERVRDFIKYTGINPEEASLQLQLDFTWHELKQRPVLMSLLRKAKTSDESAELIYRGYENGSIGGLASPEQLMAVYGPSWLKLGLKKYDYNTELATRRNKAREALSLLV